MAEAICEGIKGAGGEYDLIDAKDFKGLEGYCALAVGSSTRMKRVLPMVKRMLAELSDLSGLAAVGFGSYGWSGEAPDEIADRLKTLGAALVVDAPLKAKDYPSEEVLEKCKELGNELVKGCAS